MKCALPFAIAGVMLAGCSGFMPPREEVAGRSLPSEGRGRRLAVREQTEARVGQQRRTNDALIEKEFADEQRAQQRGYRGTLRDGSGRISGSASTSEQGTTYRDGSGRIVGSASKSPAGTTTYRDGSGRITGNASTFEGHTTFRDGSGRISGSASVSGDTTTYRDSSGRITGTAYKSPTGTITYRDADGRITGTSSGEE